jgi:hypothetical protein
MSFQKQILRPALIAGLFIVSAGTISNTAFGLSTGWPAGPSPTPLPTPPATPTPSPTPVPTPTPATTLPTPVPPSYVQVITVESPQLQYRDGSELPNTPSPDGPYTCVVAMYLNNNDPTQFEVVRTFQPRFPGNVYGAAQPVSSPTVSASYRQGQLANNVTSLTVYPHPENPYGKDILTVYPVDSHGNIILPALTPGPISILVYPVSTAKISNSLSLVANPVSNPSSSFATSPPPFSSPYPSPWPYPSPSPFGIPYPSPNPGATPDPRVNFTGDTARIDVEIDNAYPGGTTWVVVYPGTASATLPSTAREVANSRRTAPTTDLVPERHVFIEVGRGTNTVGGVLFPTTSTTTAATYTVQVIQFRPPYGGTDGMETLATANFTVLSSSFKVNSQLGKLTP